MHLYKTFAARRYLPLTASVKFRIGVKRKQSDAEFAKNTTHGNY